MKNVIGLLLILGAINLYAATPVAPFSSDQYTVALWHFNEGTGDSVYDASGNGNNGQIIGAKWADGKFGAGLLFSGIDSVKVIDKPGLHVSSVTIEAWVYSDNFGAAPHGVIVSKEYGSMASYRLQNYDGVGHVSMVTSNNWGNHITTAGSLSNGAWHYVAGVAANGYLKVYIDGTLAASAPRTIAMGYDASPLLIGAVRYVANECFRGIIDEVRISSIDRFAPMPSGGRLLAHWSFDSCNGTSVFYDATGHGFNALSSGSGLTLVPGIKDQALSCPATGFDCWAANSRDSFCLQNFSIETWFNANSLPVGGEQLKILDVTSIHTGMGNGYTFCIKANGVVDLGFWSVARSYWVEANSTTLIKAGQWYHLAGTYDGTSMKVYINGKLEATTVCAGGPVYPIGDNARIGCIKTTDERGIIDRADGRIDELKLYTYALSTENIASNYSAADPIPVLIPCIPNPTYNRRPLLRWHKNQSIATYTLQVSVNANFTSPLIMLPTVDTSFLPSADLPLGVVYWRVGNAATGAWSPSSSVTIVEKNDSIPVLIPMVPDPQTNRRPQFKWYGALGAASYIIVVDTIGNFVNPIVFLPLTDTVYTPLVNLPYGKIFWKVSSGVNPTRYSMVDTFTVIPQTGIRPEPQQDLASGPMTIVTSGQGVLLSYVVPSRMRAMVKVYSMAGVCVSTMCDEESPAGTHMLQWNGMDKNGRVLPKGGYLVRCVIGPSSVVRKIMLVR